MGETQRKIKQELYKKAYFFYWRLQNNPEYVAFYKEWKSFMDKYEKDREMALREVDASLLDRSKATRDKFGIDMTIVDPFKKIDWEGLKASKEPDRIIIEAFAHSTTNRPIGPHFETKPKPNEMTIEQYLHEAQYNPFLNLTIDLRYDKKEILLRVSQHIDVFRKAKKIKRHNRDHVDKLYLYAQVWDMRKDPGRLNFKEISKKMNSNISTTKERFYRAFELIYNQPYDPDLFNKARHTVHKETLEKQCNTCSERDTCSNLCPEVISYVMQDWRKQNYREVQVSEKDHRTRSVLGLDK